MNRVLHNAFIGATLGFSLLLMAGCTNSSDPAATASPAPTSANVPAAATGAAQGAQQMGDQRGSQAAADAAAMRAAREKAEGRR